MPLFIDARIPVRFADPAAAGPDDAVLLEGDAPPPAGAAAVARLGAAAVPGGHAIACLCCVPRGAAAEALSRLFLARARGEAAFFRRVLVAVADRDGVAAALRSDPLVSARFRLDDAPN